MEALVIGGLVIEGLVIGGLVIEGLVVEALVVGGHKGFVNQPKSRGFNYFFFTGFRHGAKKI
jgi:hypothetical protein